MEIKYHVIGGIESISHYNRITQFQILVTSQALVGLT